MKLVCNSHHRRVHVFRTPARHVKGVSRTVTMHRNDGTHCDAGILRLGDYLWSPEQVVTSIAPISQLTGIASKGKRRRGREKRPRSIV